MMDLKLEVLFTLSEPTPAMLGRIKERITAAMTEEGATAVGLNLDFGMTEFLRDTRPDT